MRKRIDPIDPINDEQSVLFDNENGNQVKLNPEIHLVDDMNYTDVNVNDSEHNRDDADADTQDADMSDIQKENIPPNHNDEAADIFYVGKKFTSFFDLCQAMNDFGKKHGVELRIITSSTLKASEKRYRNE